MASALGLFQLPVTTVEGAQEVRNNNVPKAIVRSNLFIFLFSIYIV
jgi:hypothetical protein